MDNSYSEFKVPDFNETRPWPKAKRLIDLNLPSQFTAQKSKNSRATIASAKKYSAKKTNNLSRNMSTSKKILYQRKSNAHTFKRAIDFTPNEVPMITSDKQNQQTSKLQYQRPDNQPKNNESKVYKRQSYFFGESSPLVMKPKEEKVKNSSPKSVKKEIKPERRKSTPKKKREPLSSIETQIYPQGDYSLNTSDKENFDHSMQNITAAENQISEEAVNLMNNYEKTVKVFKELQISNCSNGLNNFMALTKTNIEITSKVIQEILKLLQNNMELYSSYLNLVKNIENKPPTSTEKIISSKQNCESDNAENENDLRKLAIINSQRIQKVINKPEPVKKSEIMFATMKSNMNFLKTPKIENRGNIAESPNTNCRNITRGNVIRQLESLYDT